MEIKNEDQQVDVTDKQLVALLARLTMSLSIVDCIKQAQIDDESQEYWFTQDTYSTLVRDVEIL